MMAQGCIICPFDRFFIENYLAGGKKTLFDGQFQCKEA